MSLTGIIFLICTIVPLGFGIWAQTHAGQAHVRLRYSEVRPRNGMTGAQAAAAVLRSSGLSDVTIHRSRAGCRTTTTRATAR